MNKIVFYLLNEKGYTVLKEFLFDFNANNIAFIVVSEDRSIKKDYYNEIIEICNSNSIRWYNRSDLIPTFKGYKFAIGWRWMISDATNLIVLHDSILPRYRGFSPLVNMLINGENEIGVTALLASKEYDKGNIIAQEKLHIQYPIKIKDAIGTISTLYYNLIHTIYNWIYQGQVIKGVVQDERYATYSLWRDENDYFIDWNSDAATIKRLVDAVGFPYLGARTTLDDNIIVIDEVIEYENVKIENRNVGKVIFLDDGYPVVVCGEGLLKIVKARYLNDTSIFPLKKFRSKFGG